MKKILILLVGFLVAFVTISLFELFNYFMYPFPEGFDVYDNVALAEFAKTMPTSAFLVVLLGWAVGSATATFTILKLSKKYLSENAEILVYICAGFLTTMAVVNNFVVMPGVHPTWFHFGLSIFFVTTYLSLKYFK